MSHPANVVDVDDDNLDRLITRSDRPAILYAHAQWCAPCKASAPLYARAAAGCADDVSFLKLDVDAAPLGTERLGIRGVPTLLVFHEGREVWRAADVRRSTIDAAIDQAVWRGGTTHDQLCVSQPVGPDRDRLVATFDAARSRQPGGQISNEARLLASLAREAGLDLVSDAGNGAVVTPLIDRLLSDLDRAGLSPTSLLDRAIALAAGVPASGLSPERLARHVAWLVHDPVHGLVATLADDPATCRFAGRTAMLLDDAAATRSAAARQIRADLETAGPGEAATSLLIAAIVAIEACDEISVDQFSRRLRIYPSDAHRHALRRIDAVVAYEAQMIAALSSVDDDGDDVATADRQSARNDAMTAVSDQLRCDDPALHARITQGGIAADAAARERLNAQVDWWIDMLAANEGSQNR
ncbi:thioredoxin family protein [Sphingomonas hankookensis]